MIAISPACASMRKPPAIRSSRHQHERRRQHGDEPEAALEPLRAEHRRQRQQQAPAEVDDAQRVGAEAERERRVGEQREEAEVVERGDQRHAAQPAVAERPQRLGQRDPPLGLRRRPEQDGDEDEADRHQRGGAEERPAPGDAAQQAAEQRAGGDAEAERGLVEHDRAGQAAARRADDDREGGGDEQRVAEPPAEPEAGDLEHRARGTGERAEHDHEARPSSSVRREPIRLAVKPENSIATPVIAK